MGSFFFVSQNFEDISYLLTELTVHTTFKLSLSALQRLYQINEDKLTELFDMICKSAPLFLTLSTNTDHFGVMQENLRNRSFFTSR